MKCRLCSIDFSHNHLDLVQNQNCCNFLKMPRRYMVSKICSVKNFILTSECGYLKGKPQVT
eukprot:UN13632